MLLSEVITSSDKMKRTAHVAARFAIDTHITKVERHVGIYGPASPSGAVAAIDLTFFAALMTLGHRVCPTCVSASFFFFFLQFSASTNEPLR